MIVHKLPLSMLQNLLSYSSIIVHLDHSQYFALINNRWLIYAFISLNFFSNKIIGSENEL